jgi:hypothetical protein
VVERLLGVAGADLLDVGVMQRRLRAGIPIRPDKDPLRPHLDVHALVVPAEQTLEDPRRHHRLGGGELHERLAPVTLAVRRQVAVVDLGHALDQNADAALDPGAGGIREQ